MSDIFWKGSVPAMEKTCSSNWVRTIVTENIPFWAKCLHQKSRLVATTRNNTSPAVNNKYPVSSSYVEEAFQHRRPLMADTEAQSAALDFWVTCQYMSPT